MEEGNVYQNTVQQRREVKQNRWKMRDVAFVYPVSLEIHSTGSQNDQSNNLHVYVESVTCAVHENTA